MKRRKTCLVGSWLGLVGLLWLACGTSQQGKCQAGETKCQGNNVATCQGDGSWTEIPCVNGSCESGVCKKPPAVCQAGTSECKDASTTRECLPSGAWKETACPQSQTCEKGRCAPPKRCKLDVQPRKHTFARPERVTITLHNTGDAACEVKRLLLKNTNGPFSLEEPPTTPQMLAPLGRLEVFVRFLPTDKQRHTVALLIQSSDPDTPAIEVLLDGQSTKAACEPTLTPAALDFQFVPVGEKRSLSLTLKNEGWGDCKVTALRLDATGPLGAGAFALSPKAPLELPSGVESALNITYTPRQTGSYTAKLSVDLEGASSLSATLQGLAKHLCLVPIPQSPYLGAATLQCDSPTRTLGVYLRDGPGCPQSLKVTGITLAKKTSSPFRIVSVHTSLPASTQAGNAVWFTIAYKAQKPNPETDIIEVHHDATPTPLLIPVSAQGTNETKHKDVFIHRPPHKVDVLFVVDNDHTMAKHQTSLSNNFGAFLQLATQNKVDFHIGVTNNQGSGGAHNVGCLHGDTPIITSKTPDPAAVFAKNVRFDTLRSTLAYGLEASVQALEPPRSIDPQCNKGFYRKDAMLSVIYVTDKPDNSEMAAGFYISFFEHLKGYQNRLQIQANALGPYSRLSPQCSSGACRYYEMTKQMQGFYEKLDTAALDWNKTLTTLARRTFGYPSKFTLLRHPEGPSIQVQVDGVSVAAGGQQGWQYEPSTNTIHFANNQVLRPNAVVTVEYTAACAP